MPVIMTTVNTRLTPAIEFKILPESTVQYIKTQYQDTGKILSIVGEFSQDMLTRTVTITFSDHDAALAYRTDATLYEAFNTVRMYNSANGITLQRTIVNE